MKNAQRILEFIEDYNDLLEGFNDELEGIGIRGSKPITKMSQVKIANLEDDEYLYNEFYDIKELEL